MANLLEEILARAQQPGGPEVPYDIGQTDEPSGFRPGSIMDELLKKKKPASEFLPPLPATPLAQFGPQAGIIAPGVGGLGNMDPATTRAPVSPVDPNYAAPASTADQLMALVQPSGAKPPPPPLPVPRPTDQIAREADGAVLNDTSTPAQTGGSPRAREARAQVGAVAAPAAPAPAAAPAAGPGMAPQSILDDMGSLGGRFMKGLHDNSNLLLALGAGFAGAPNIGQGIGRAAGFAIPGHEADIKQQTAQSQQSSLYQALVQAGAPKQQAFAAVSNPKMAEKLMDQYLVDQKMEIKEVKSKNSWGEESTQLIAVDPRDPRRAFNVGTGQPLGVAGAVAPGPTAPAEPGTAAAAGVAARGSGGMGGGPQSAFYAPGISDENFDHAAVGEDYIKQLSPEVQADAKEYLSGRRSFTGRQAYGNRIKQIATKYGNDIGMPADDAALGQRKQWANSLGDTKSGVGLQAKGLQQGLEHFVKLSDNMVKLNLSNGLGFEPAAGWANYFKSLTTKQQEVLKAASVQGQMLSGEMGNLFSKNGGGVHERAATAKAVSDGFQSSKAAAGSLEGILEMVDGGLNTLEQRRDELFPGGTAPRGSNFMGPKQKADYEKIKHNIAILKGEAPRPGATEAPAAATLKPQGHYIYDAQGNLVESK